MSVKWISWAFERDINPTAKLVLLALANAADAEGVAFPGQARLARHTNYCDRTVRRQLANLEELGLITQMSEQARRKGGLFARSVYELGTEAERADSLSYRRADSLSGRRPDTVTGRRADARGRTGGLSRGASIDDPSDDPSGEGSGRGDTFEDFKAAMPSRGLARHPWSEAAKLFARHVKAGVAPAVIVVGACGYAEVCRKKGDAGTEYVCQATTFLSQRRWEQYQPERSEARQAKLVARVAPGCPSDAAERWRVFIEHQATMDRARTASWLAPLVFDGSALLAPGKFHADWVRQQFETELRVGGFEHIEIATQLKTGRK